MQSFSLDYHTLFLASGIVAAALLALHTIQARRLYPGFVRIVVGVDLLTAAIVAANLMGYGADALWGIQVTSLFAFALIDSGIRLFCTTPFRGWWPYVYVVTAILLQTYLYLTQPLYLRIIVNSLLLIPIFVDASLPFLRMPPKGCGFGYRFAGAVLMFGCVVACVRIVAMSHLRGHPSPYFSAHPANTLFFSLIMFLLLALSFGFIALTHERLVSDLEFTHEKLGLLVSDLAFTDEKLRLLYENAPVGIILVDQKGFLTSANQRFAEISGYSPTEAVGLTYSDVASSEDKATAGEVVEGLLSGKIQSFTPERRLLRKDGSTIWVRMITKIVRDKSANPQWGIVVFEDITERKQAEEALLQSREKFRATFEYAPIGIAECTVEGKFIEANSTLVEILGYTQEEIAHLTLIDVTHPSERELSLSRIQKLTAGEIDTYAMEKRYIRKDRSLVWVNERKSLTSIQGDAQHMILTVEDTTARKKAEEDLKRTIESSYYEANHDMLTGLANRASFDDQLPKALVYAKRDGHLVAIHLLDLDRFKSVNDTLGHHTGDLLLKEVANRIKSRIRETDLAARIGGDEFVVLQTHLADPSAAGVLAERLIEDLGRKYTLNGEEVQSGASIGIALYPNDARDAETLMRHADLALYDAKHLGRSNYQFYRRNLGSAYREVQQRQEELVRALQEKEFYLQYQPQFDLKGGRITGIEALLRWCHPAKGQLAAAEFIGDAERARLTLPIGDWVLRAACRQYKEWVDSGFAAPLTVNLSSMQLQDPRFLQKLRDILEETGLSASMLQLEIRESVLSEPRFSNNLLKQMKADGLHLALSEFGSAMTALLILERFPLDVVKPSQGLVRALPAGKRERTILAAIIGIAHDLRIQVCAEGVETESQFSAVKEQGCDSVQGYLLSSPLNNDEMTQRIDLDLSHLKQI